MLVLHVGSTLSRVAGRVLVVSVIALVLVAGAPASTRADEWTVSISAPSTVLPGADFAVTASVTYTYATGNDNIVLSVQLPNDATIKDFSDHTNCNTSGCTFHGLSGTASVTYTLTAPASPGPNLNSSASSFNGFLAPTPPPSASAITTVVAPPPPITISVSGSSHQVNPGGSVSFSVSLSNTGASAIPDVSLSNQLGVDWSDESMSQTGGPAFSCSHPDAFDTFCQIATFPAGATATFSATATAAMTAAIGAILNSRFFGSASTVWSVEVVAPTAGTTTTTPAPPPPPPTTTAAATTTTSSTTTPTTTTQTTTPTAPQPAATPCTVPRLVGLPLAAARLAAAHHRCALTVTYARSNKAPKGRVIRQAIPAGTHLRNGTRVRIVVSNGRRWQHVSS